MYIMPAILAERVAGTEEFCSLCFRVLNFPKSLHIDDVRRLQGGAKYIEGSGQFCPQCAR